jgi:RimJ/RimL family protein N-acetyltransferase
MAWPETFKTSRLRADRLRAEHFPDLRRIHTDTRVMEHLGGAKTEDQTLSYLERNLAHWDSHQHGVWMLFERDRTTPIGLAVLRHLLVDEANEVETGYAFREPHWGRGYATEITRACLAHGFDRLRLPSIVAVTTPGNARSQHVLEKCGFDFDRTFTRGDEPLSLYRIDRGRYHVAETPSSQEETDQ